MRQYRGHNCEQLQQIGSKHFLQFDFYYLKNRLY